MVGVTYGLIYSFSVFFKPLADHFNWDRTTVSFVYSAFVLIRGFASIGAGWLADKYGTRKVMIVCGFLMGLGFVLSSRATELWQLFMTYAVIGAIGFSGTFGIGTAIVARWFTERRGLALGIVASGSGVGTLLIVPGTERLIAAVDWSQAFLVCGIAAGVLMIAAAMLLREPLSQPKTTDSLRNVPIRSERAAVEGALRDPRMLLTALAFLFFFFGIQMVMVHLVNYATDAGIDPLIAATFISVIGLLSIIGRLSIGIGADKIGIYHSLMLTRVFLVISFILLLFAHSTWSFYLFAVLFSLPYGGEITQIPLVIGRYFGTQAMATLMGIIVFTITIGGALGPWVAGKIFDATNSYDWAFIAGAFAAACSVIIVLIMRRRDRQFMKD